MKAIRNILRKDKRPWPNPRESIGKLVRTSPDGKSTYWIAKGPARKIWEEIDPDIRTCIEACGHGSALLIVEIYMFGSNEDTAAPQILICSGDETTRKQVFRAIEQSEIMHKYPAIGLGQLPRLTRLRSQDDIELSLTPTLSTSVDVEVLTAPLDKPFGRRLFIPKRNGSSLRPATAGPILHINGKVYQLTVGHAFLESGDFPLPLVGGDVLDSHQPESQAEMGDGDFGSQDVNIRKHRPENNPLLTGDAHGDISQLPLSSVTHYSSVVAAGRQASLDSGVGLVQDDVAAANGVMVPRKLEPLGKRAWVSDTCNPSSPDYALVELEGAYCQGSNEVPCGPNGSQRFLQVTTRPAEDGPQDVNIITMTASSGFMTGKLCATASYVRFPNQRTLQKLFLVLLDGEVADGDCGSGVVDQATGHMYGHIVAGTAGTGQAYIVPIEDVFRDIKAKMGGSATLIDPRELVEPPSDFHFKLEHLKIENLKREMKARFKAESYKRGEPLRVVEFASEEYFKKLSPRPSQVNDTIHSVQQLRPDICQAAGPSSWEQSSNRPLPLAPKQPSSAEIKGSQSIVKRPLQIPTRKLKIMTLKTEAEGKGRSTGNPMKREWNAGSFEKHFFALPSDIRVHVIAYLSVPEILDLRRLSKDWLGFITANETPISRAFLQNNPVPRFAKEIYRLPAPADLDLYYISGLWHRLSVTSRLSTLMAEWMTTDIFLRKSESQQQDFSPQQARIRRRLIPIIFTLTHFFENYRNLHLKHVLENDHPLLPGSLVINPLERHIMAEYDNETLLQVNQVFPVLISYLKRKLRPPSYFGRLEKALHGYVGRPFPDGVHVGILCIGGIREVTRINEMDGYESRRAAVDEWYTTVFQQRIEYPSEPGHWSLALVSKKSKHSSSSAIKQASAAVSTSHRVSRSSDTYDAKITKDKGKQKESASSLSRSTIKPLRAEHARLLLQDLPVLENIWVPTAEALLLARRAVERWQDIKRNGQAMHELILDEFTAADELYYGCTEEEFRQETIELGWEDLLDDHFRRKGCLGREK